METILTDAERRAVVSAAGPFVAEQNLAVEKAVLAKLRLVTQVRADPGWKVVVLDTIRNADKGHSEPHHDLIWIPSGCSLAIITYIPEEQR